mgnify:CR=1 FL=1
MKRIRPGNLQIKTDADSLYQALEHADKVIIFSPQYGDSAGVQGDDNITAGEGINEFLYEIDLIKFISAFVILNFSPVE